MVAKERSLLPALLKGLLGAARIIKLYPLKSKAVSSAIDHLMKTLSGIFQSQSAITLSQASNTLLVNGNRVDVTDFKTFADGFVKFLNIIGLSSLTFTENVDTQEIETLVESLGSVYPDGADGEPVGDNGVKWRGGGRTCG
jgi:hypothetical protein